MQIPDSRVVLNESIERQNSREVLGQKHKQNVGVEQNISTVNSVPTSLSLSSPIPPTRPSPLLIQIPCSHELAFVPHNIDPSKCTKINDNYDISPPYEE